jgi:transposase
MKQKSGPGKAPAEQVLGHSAPTRRQYSAEEKIRIVLRGTRRVRQPPAR